MDDPRHTAAAVIWNLIANRKLWDLTGEAPQSEGGNLTVLVREVLNYHMSPPPSPPHVTALQEELDLLGTNLEALRMLVLDANGQPQLSQAQAREMSPRELGIRLLKNLDGRLAAENSPWPPGPSKRQGSPLQNP